VFPYLELTIPATTLVPLLVFSVLGTVGCSLALPTAPGGLRNLAAVLWLSWVSVVMILGVVQHWHWRTRLSLGLLWLLALVGCDGTRLPGYLVVTAFVAGALVVGRQFLVRARPVAPIPG
jgi:hypothetical protein